MESRKRVKFGVRHQRFLGDILFKCMCGAWITSFFLATKEVLEIKQHEPNIEKQIHMNLRMKRYVFYVLVIICFAVYSWCHGSPHIV